MASYPVFAKPARAVGEFFAMALDTLVLMFKRPFAWREFLVQTWFVARVSIVPTLLLAIPLTVLTIFIFNILLVEIGASDLSGTAAALATITQQGPFVTALVVSGAAATAMCADLGSRTIREELDAMRVMGIDPVQALVVPRVLAATFISLMLTSLTTIVGIVGPYFFAVYVQHVSPGAFASGMTLLVGTPEVVVLLIKSAVFGMVAGLIACYKGISVGGGPQGVGDAVNETVVYGFAALLVVHAAATVIATKVLP
ncbi:MAG: MlaE family ABC transporter permease [Mycobacterium sp.]